MRILCLGIGSEKSGKYSYRNFAQSGFPTISDYDLVIMNLGNVLSAYYSNLANAKEEFAKFFNNRGVCFVIFDTHEYYEKSTFSNLDWCPFSEKIRIENRRGETLTCKYKKAQFIFDQIKFLWRSFFSEIPKDSTVLATNRTNDPISVIIPYGSGFCVFLPWTYDLDELLDLLIEKGLNIIPQVEEEAGSSSVPSWTSSIMSKAEVDLLESMSQIEGKLGKYNRYRALLWETGENLQNLVVSAFKELGIDVAKLPKESHADLEITLDKNLTGVCEVKGLMGEANIQDLRQLLDYFVEQRDIERRNVKGIFIVNHYRNEEPSKREKPVTREASDLMKKYGFTLLTATQLYEYLTKCWQGQLTKEEILRGLCSQS